MLEGIPHALSDIVRGSLFLPKSGILGVVRGLFRMLEDKARGKWGLLVKVI